MYSFLHVHIFADLANFGRFAKIKDAQNFPLNGILENEFTSNMHKIHISRNKHITKTCTKNVGQFSFFRINQ